MTQVAPPWALIAASGFALLQAWGWYEEHYFVLSGALVILAGTLIAVAINPRTKLAKALAYIWAPAMRPNEKPQRYRLRVACYWLLAGVSAFLLLWLILRFVRDQESILAIISILGLGLFIPAAIFMAAQSILRAFLTTTSRDAPNNRLERRGVSSSVSEGDGR